MTGELIAYFKKCNPRVEFSALLAVKTKSLQDDAA